VAFDWFQVWWPLEGLMFGDPWKVSMFGGLWMVPSLVALGRFQCLVVFGKRKKNNIFTSFHFPPLQRILLKPFFSIDFNVLLYYGSRLLLHTFPSFSLTYKL